MAGTFLIDLSKAFDRISYVLSTVKTNVCYWIFEDTHYFIYLNLKRRKQKVDLYKTETLLQMSVTGFSQNAILGPILFNIFRQEICISKFLLGITLGLLQGKA